MTLKPNTDAFAAACTTVQRLLRDAHYATDSTARADLIREASRVARSMT